MENTVTDLPEALLAEINSLAADTEATSQADATKANAEGAEAETETNETADAKPEADAETGAGDEPAEKGDADAKDEESDDEDEKPRKRRTGAERLKRQLAAKDAEIAQLRELAERSPKPSDGDAIARAVEAEIGPPPKEEDYAGDYLAYEAERAAYIADKRATTREVKKALAAQATRAQSARQDVIEDHRDRVEELAKSMPEVREKLAKAVRSAVQPSATVQDLVLESEKSALLAVHLADRPKLVDDLNRMSERQAAKEIGRLEARLSLPKPQTATKAQPPVKPVKGAATPSSPEREMEAWLKRTYAR